MSPLGHDNIAGTRGDGWWDVEEVGGDEKLWHFYLVDGEQLTSSYRPNDIS